ncbi:Serine/arginine repetitive matrix protein 2 [Linum grandiflorum]
MFRIRFRFHAICADKPESTFDISVSATRLAPFTTIVSYSPPTTFSSPKGTASNRLQTARGSGTNGHIQTNKFFVRPITDKVAHTSKGFGEDQGTAGITKKPSKNILEHDRKRQLQLKLVVLEDKLLDQGFTDAEIAQKLEEARGF